MFAVADSGAVFFALQLVTNVDEDSRLHTFLTVVLSLLGVVLVITGMAAGRHLKDAFLAWRASRAASREATATDGETEVAEAGGPTPADGATPTSWVEDAVAGAAFTALAVLGVVVVGMLRQVAVRPLDQLAQIARLVDRHAEHLADRLLAREPLLLLVEPHAGGPAGRHQQPAGAAHAALPWPVWLFLGWAKIILPATVCSTRVTTISWLELMNFRPFSTTTMVPSSR